MSRILRILMGAMVVLIVLSAFTYTYASRFVKEDILILDTMAVDIHDSTVHLAAAVASLDDVIQSDMLYMERTDSVIYGSLIDKGQTKLDEAMGHAYTMEDHLKQIGFVLAVGNEAEVKLISDRLSAMLKNSLVIQQYLDGNYRSYTVLELQKIENILRDQIERSDDITGQAALIMEKYQRVYSYAILFLNISILSVLLSLFIFMYHQLKFQDNFIREALFKIDRYEYDFQAIQSAKPWFQDDKILYSKVEKIFREERVKKSIKHIVSDSYDLDSVVSNMFNMLKTHMDISRIGVAFIDYYNKKITTEVSISDYDDILMKPGYKVDFGVTSLAEILEHKEGIITVDLEAELEKKPESESLRLIVDEGIRSNMVLPFLSDDKVFGLVFISATSPDYFTESMKEQFTKMVTELSEVFKRSYLIKVALKQFSLSFSELVDNKDIETGDHLERMTSYADVIVEYLYRHPVENYIVDTRFLKDIHDYAAVHDIGKVAVPDNILHKKGKLNDLEWTVMKGHVTIGQEIISSIHNALSLFDSEYFSRAEEIVTYHHERWEGGGYPRGLKYHDIPLAARIVSIADVFDALTSKRAYKPAFDFEKSVDIIISEKGKQFDPYLVNVFEKVLDQIHLIYIKNRQQDIEVREAPVSGRGIHETDREKLEQIQGMAGQADSY